mgnify:FL=1
MAKLKIEKKYLVSTFYNEKKKIELNENTSQANLKKIMKLTDGKYQGIYTEDEAETTPTTED